MKVFITKSAVYFLIISFSSLIFLPYANFSSVKAVEAGTETFEPAVLGEIENSFGTFPSEPAAFASMFLTIAVGVAGGVAFLLMVYGSYRLIFAGGNPESVQSARQIITSAIVGLLMIIFSVFILRLIGISILGLPL